MTIYEKMLSQYNEERGTATPNAPHEVMQQLVLAGLHIRNKVSDKKNSENKNRT